MSDSDKQPRESEADAEQARGQGPKVTIEGDPTPMLEALRKSTSVLSAMPSIQAATRMNEIFGVARRQWQPSISAQASKSVSEMAKSVMGSSGVADALKSTNAARDILGSFGVAKRPDLTLSAEAMRWQAEKAAARVQTRDAVWSLADAIESLAESQRRSDRKLIWLTVAILALTALIAFKDFL
jgi:hypothetical protein